MKVIEVFADSPAEEAGIEVGDLIVEVEGTMVTADNYSELSTSMGGEEGSTLNLVVRRDSQDDDVEIVRRNIEVPMVTWEQYGDVGYIKIKEFHNNTPAQFNTALKQLTGNGVKALIFDVRNNPGGYVSELTEILDFLLPEGDIFIERTVDGEEIVYSSDAACVDLPMAVLVNSESYSAAEFLAAQLRESVGAVVAGEQTSGKGYSQVLFDLPNGSSIGLSTARYYTGGGVSLIGTGLNPDPAISLSQEDQEKLLAGTLAPQEDAQLQAALQALSGQS